ncbi:MAG: class III poly(R)-hydroxyalkanoic acid synthase subunit PhaC [Planctomycetaceae bacterium]|nr:class III poly(R)-hydroxyalkanoic acid synthase subunit PhaC [Planctomycetaceae bacterium]
MQALLKMAFEMQQQAWQEGLNQWNRMLNTPSVADHALRQNVAGTPHDVVFEKDALKLYHYRRDTPAAVREPVLICYALVNRPYILDLQPARSVIRRLLEGGLDVYLIDWGVPTAADRTLGLNDYICGSMRKVADVVRQRSGMPTFNLLGYCMGGTMSTIFTALYPELVNSLGLMAAPIDFSGDDALLHVWTNEKYFDVDRLVDAYGNCPATFLQATFLAMKPVQNFIEKYTGFAENMHDDRFLENYFAMEKWTNDNIPVAGETFREFVKCLYQQNQLVKGQFKIGGNLVDLKQITCPLLLMAAEFDHLVRPESTFGLIPHVESKVIEKREIRAGHVGLAVSSKAHQTFWPQAAEWFVQNSTAAPSTEDVEKRSAEERNEDPASAAELLDKPGRGRRRSKGRKKS